MFLILVAGWLVPLLANARRPLLRVPRGAPSTGSYIVVSRDGISSETFERLLRETSRLSDGTPVITRNVVKTITVKLSKYFLERVSEEKIKCKNLK